MNLLLEGIRMRKQGLFKQSQQRLGLYFNQIYPLSKGYQATEVEHIKTHYFLGYRQPNPLWIEQKDPLVNYL